MAIFDAGTFAGRATAAGCVTAGLTGVGCVTAGLTGVGCGAAGRAGVGVAAGRACAKVGIDAPIAIMHAAAITIILLMFV